MRVLSTKRYNELIEAEKKMKQYSGEVQRKEFCIQRKQKVINTIYKELNKLPDNAKKEDLNKALENIQNSINN